VTIISGLTEHISWIVTFFVLQRSNDCVGGDGGLVVMLMTIIVIILLITI